MSRGALFCLNDRQTRRDEADRWQLSRYAPLLLTFNSQPTCSTPQPWPEVRRGQLADIAFSYR